MTRERLRTRQSAAPLTQTLASGGKVLVARQLFVMVVAFGSVVVVTRIIGPTQYGIYAAAFGIAFLVQTWAELSLDVYLVRKDGRITVELCDQIWSLLWVLGLLASGILVALSGPLAALIDANGSRTVLAAMFISILLIHGQQVPLSLLERDLRYSRIGLIEVAAQISFASVSVSAALAGAGAWAPVAGWYVQQVALLVGYWSSAQYSPRLRWRSNEVADLLRFGALATSASAAYSTRNLVAPLLVGGALGPAALGYVSLATRLVEQAGFAKTVITRMSYAVMGRVGSDIGRKRAAIQGAMDTQLVGVGLPLAGLALLAPFVVPAVFGPDWSPVVRLIPLLVPGALLVAAFSIHLTSLISRKPPWEVIVSNVVVAATMWVAAAALVPHFGLLGYGYADLISGATWVLLAVLHARVDGPPRYLFALVWLAAISCLALAPAYSWYLLVPALVLLVNPLTLRRAIELGRPLIRRHR